MEYKAGQGTYRIFNCLPYCSVEVNSQGHITCERVFSAHRLFVRLPSEIR